MMFVCPAGYYAYHGATKDDPEGRHDHQCPLGASGPATNPSGPLIVRCVVIRTHTHLCGQVSGRRLFSSVAHGHSNNWLVQGLATHGSVELGVTEAEEPTIRGHLPVAAACRGRCHPDYWLVQRFAAHGSVELGVTEAEEPTVRGHLPVAARLLSGSQ